MARKRGQQATRPAKRRDNRITIEDLAEMLNAHARQIGTPGTGAGFWLAGLVQETSNVWVNPKHRRLLHRQARIFWWNWMYHSGADVSREARKAAAR